MKFTVYSANILGNPANCLYPNERIVSDAEGLSEAVRTDYVCARYDKFYRAGDKFLYADCLPVDCDNDHSEQAEDWKTPEDVARAFPGVGFAVHYSRNDMKPKGGAKPRPRFHILFPITRMTDRDDYAALKRRVSFLFPFFDTKALDASRFFFGTSEGLTEWHEGEALDLWLDKDTDDPFAELCDRQDVIPEGSRNSTMSRFAARVLKRYGETEEAKAAFDTRAEKCVPPLEAWELATIWRSALGFYRRKVVTAADYIAPGEWNAGTYKPEDFSDVGQAEVLAKHFSHELRYSPATGFLRYAEHYWQESETGAQAVAHELTRRQMEEAAAQMAKADARMNETGAREECRGRSENAARRNMTDEQSEAYDRQKAAEKYLGFALRRRDSSKIASTLKEVRPMITVAPRDLDADCYLLNTPEATYDLRKGMSGARAHDPTDFITKITAVSPNGKGAELWEAALLKFFCRDEELINYVQQICGLAAVGKVFVEALIIAYGDGSNGKSTFWNTVSRVLGLYAGNLSADALTTGCRRNLKPEMAETKGKRLILAAELQEGQRLNDSMVKQLCSTDEIFAEKKFKDPFAFTPCHTLVLYTNHLPKVSASDDGIWRRLIVVPFKAKISRDGDIKNYSDYLFENAGGAVLRWIIEGAEKVIKKDFAIEAPAIVTEAIKAYRDKNNWFQHFLDDCCEVDETFSTGSQELYRVYQSYCGRVNEYVRSTQDFYDMLERKGFKKMRSRSFGKAGEMKTKVFGLRPAEQNGEADFS